jgi:hypothetical protein
MKCVVIACKNIVEYAESHEKDIKQNLDPIKVQLSAKLTNLMNLAKDHATKNTAATCAPLEGAVSELSKVVGTLLQAVAGLEGPKIDQQPPYEIPDLKVLQANLRPSWRTKPI